ncbi:MAG: site-specific integrase [Defluviitaleaceae bacterium]|nr:site-specific integrase [Defluviitaleaceae bacterium]
MTGSLQPKNGVFYMVINTKTAEGKRKQKWVSTGLTVKGNKRKAEQQLNAFLTEYGKNGYSEPSNVMFCDYMDSWVEQRRLKVQEKTHETNTFNLNKHIIPFFKKTGLSLANVEPEIIKAYCDLKLTECRSPNTVIRQYAMIRAALNYAYKSRLIPSNPCDFVEKPKGEKYIAEFYNADDIKALLAVFKGSAIEVPVLIAAYFGLRRSEVIGLRWSALDLINGSLTVRQKVVQVTQEGKRKNIISDKLKNFSSRRTLPLDDKLITVFSEIKKQQEYNREICGNSYCTDYLDYICVNKMGELINPETLSRQFSKTLRQNNMRVIRYHDLRHSCASLLLALGYSMKDLQEWLGHASMRTTADIYAHADPKNKGKMIRGLTSALSTE